MTSITTARQTALTCKMVTRAVPIDPYAAFSPVTAEVYCETHNMPLTTTDSLCPIGRIEQAASKALRAIDLATDDAITSVLDAKG